MTSCIPNVNKDLDLETPRNELLSAFYKRSFAHYTVMERMPVILTKTLDSLVRDKAEIANQYGKESLEELKTVIGELSKLKYEIQTNKKLTLFESISAESKQYNDYLKMKLDENVICTYFNMVWLYVECYMYRRIYECFQLTTKLQDYDPFKKQKIEGFNNALPLIELLGKMALDILNGKEGKSTEENFITLLKCDLWTNKCDISFSISEGQVEKTDIFSNDSLNKNLLCDSSLEVWKAANADSMFNLIDIVLDNSGYELFADLCLADFIITNNLATAIRIYVKSIPWFISDVLKDDFFWLLEQLRNSNNECLKTLGQRWTEYVEDNTWRIEIYSFWTSPYPYKDMFKVDENLYRHLARAKLIIFKGDLNYRKLFGERNWEPTTPVCDALEGFHPTRICTLRTLKADLICGLEEEMVKKAESEDSKWLISGNYGVIQYCGKVVHLL